MSTLSLQIDAAQVLSVSPDASLQEIRDAYRFKAKRYHPDAGGEDWAFRILSQAYEVMSTTRVVRASAREESAPPRARPQPQPQSRPRAEAYTTPPPREPRNGVDPQAARESVRPGVRDSAGDPQRVVDVERLSIRYQPDHVWLINDHTNENRLLSCSLNLTWPSPDLPGPAEGVSDHAKLLIALEGVFATMNATTRAATARSAIVDGRFSGWLSYPTTEASTEAFEQLRANLHHAGLSVNQWSRDLVVPRQRH